MAKISQREARRLRKRVAELERQNRDRINGWSQAWPQGGVNIDHITMGATQIATVDTAMRLGYCIVGKLSDSGLRIYAVKP